MHWALLLGIFLLFAAFLTLWWLQKTEPEPLSKNCSPVPWISQEVWAHFHQESDPDGLQRLKFTRLSFVTNPQVLIATEQDRLRTPKFKLTSQNVPQSASLEREPLKLELASIPGKQAIKRPLWPVCCQRLTCLVCPTPSAEALNALETKVGSLDDAFLENELSSWGGQSNWKSILDPIRKGQAEVSAINIFQCTHCQALYVASCQAA